MHLIDYSIVGAYLVLLLGAGLYLSRRASQGVDAYFLGNRELPWWAIGASGMTSNLDAAGTMTIVTLIYQFGVHGFFIEMRGGVVLPIAVFLAFMGKWHQRSGVVTTAEWMSLRFGTGVWGKSSRMLAALTYVTITIGMVVFFLAAAGKFLATFLPFEAQTCAVAMAIIALTYTLLSGLYGVIWTDVFQAVLIGGIAIYVAVRAGLLIDAEMLANWEAARLNTVLPRWSDPSLGEYELFIAFLLAWTAKGLLEGMGGSGGSAYMAQRFYAARSPADCQRIGMLWVFLFAFRWPMALGFAVIGMSLGLGGEDPERLLPQALLSDFFPVGIRGLAISAIFAASMSTFDSTINAGASYITRDLFAPLFPQASDKAQVRVGYVASVAIVAVGLLLALTATSSVVDVWILIVVQLFPAFLVPFALRWYWGRFNGAGFSLGIVFGFAMAICVSSGWIGGDWNELASLGAISATSLCGCFLGTFVTGPTDESVLRTFYQKIRPNGLWPKEWSQPYEAELKGNWLRLLSALVWQVSTFMIPMFAVLGEWGRVMFLAAVWGLSLWGLLKLREREA
ncbi:hypothetical protein [Pelagicoccus sp. SDUM812002]|uniref:sodium:solute symporter family transporter n=1 Tax=Pelagicoccus sp. SDUM812002 TaxID=3041266 RepID=UPI00280EE1DC|nr:hypothetical protein [Pelagicoccus sp. SDUM812002]MDQ8187146.1 hypothetical protein [Pelagicoccus sp. SDUM812002]